MNALWHNPIRPNLRILLLNNGGGEIFETLPGLETEATRRFVTGQHQTSAQSWAEGQQFVYLKAHNEPELLQAMQTFTQPEPAERPILLEVFTDKAEDIRLLNAYYSQLKENHQS